MTRGPSSAIFTGSLSGALSAVCKRAYLTLPRRVNSCSHLHLLSASSLAAVVIDAVLYRQQPPKVKYTKARVAGIEGDEEVLVARTGQDGQRYDAPKVWPNTAYKGA